MTVLPVKYWSSPDYTRVAIRVDKPVRFKSRLLEQRDGKPRRLYIDFYGAYIPPRYRTPIPIKDGLLQQVRSGQFDDSTVRVVLDIESISDYKVFSLQDPFRVVVDVWGKKGLQRRYQPVVSKTAPASSTQRKSQETTAGAQAASRQKPQSQIEDQNPEAEVPVLSDQKKVRPGTKEEKTSSAYSVAYSFIQPGPTAWPGGAAHCH